MSTYPYITLIASYLLVGVVVSFLLESFLRFTGHQVSGKERFVMIIGWPWTSLVFIVNFIKGLLGKD